MSCSWRMQPHTVVMICFNWNENIENQSEWEKEAIYALWISKHYSSNFLPWNSFKAFEDLWKRTLRRGTYNLKLRLAGNLDFQSKILKNMLKNFRNTIIWNKTLIRSELIWQWCPRILIDILRILNDGVSVVIPNQIRFKFKVLLP